MLSLALAVTVQVTVQHGWQGPRRLCCDYKRNLKGGLHTRKYGTGAMASGGFTYRSFYKHHKAEAVNQLIAWFTRSVRHHVRNTFLSLEPNVVVA